MSKNSSVGNSRVYEAGDQHTSRASELGSGERRFNEGVPNSHQPNDTSKSPDTCQQDTTDRLPLRRISEDQRSLANRAAAERQASDSPQESLETTLGKKDATLPAKIHGNKPSRGAQIDAELQAEDEAAIRKKDN
ncbi:hypothetical protein QBC44DRAFT_65823 [Cladorrhinum sp. PSN332]|nr:hypothetical protein QBC44DRAFT_65823 [Cladorrhinum sp. PSN332]